MFEPPWIVPADARVLVTGAGGYVGVAVVAALLQQGFTRIRAQVRVSSDRTRLDRVRAAYPASSVEVFPGNLLNPADCRAMVQDAALVFHLVTGRGKSYPGCFQNSVVTTRNLLDACVAAGAVKRFVNVSSFAVYSNWRLAPGAVLDETCPLEEAHALRYDAYVYGKRKQDALVERYQARHGLPFVHVRPTVVFGPGRRAIPAAVGINTFGFFLHLGGRKRVPLTYIDNCADAIVLAGLKPGVEGECFNVVDDDLPSSRAFLALYKRRVRRFRSVFVPYPVFFACAWLWERYAAWSEGQLPPVINRRYCAFFWKGHRYGNTRLKTRLGWEPRVGMRAALERYLAYQAEGRADA